MNRVRLIQQLKIDEGTGPRSADGSFMPYQDQFGDWTIGYGRNLSAEGISTVEAEQLMGNDIDQHTLALSQRLDWCLDMDEARANALANMCFNLGIEKLLTFVTFLAFMKDGQYQAASQDLRGTEWYRQVGLRAVRIALLIETGTFPS